MEESPAILNQISYLKDSLDLVNREIEASIQTTREIESELVGCNEMEIELASKESELMKTCYALEFQVNGFSTLAADSRASVNSMEKELCRQTSKRDKVFATIDTKREDFLLYSSFIQRTIQADQTVASLLSQKESLENEYELLRRKDTALCHSMSAFIGDVLEGLKSSISALETEIETEEKNNNKILKDIDDLRMTLLQTGQQKLQVDRLLTL